MEFDKQLLHVAEGLEVVFGEQVVFSALDVYLLKIDR